MPEEPELSTTVIPADDRRVLGIVVAEGIRGISIQQDYFASIKNFFGGRVGAYERDMTLVREQAQKDMIDQAKRMGATGIDGIMFSFFALQGSKYPFLCVSCWGTAIKHTRAAKVRTQETSHVDFPHKAKENSEGVKSAERAVLEPSGL